MRYVTVMASPLGPLRLQACDDDLTGVYMVEHRHDRGVPTDARWVAGPFREAIMQLQQYFAGQRCRFDLPLAPAGTAFQRQVWAELRLIPYGETVTYTGLACRVGRPTAGRAVGAANGQNPLSIILPCHRVVGSSGSLTGYAGGLDRKRHLLDLERRVVASPPKQRAGDSIGALGA